MGVEVVDALAHIWYGCTIMSPESHKNKSARNPKILIVDDHSEWIQRLTRSLDGLGVSNESSEFVEDAVGIIGEGGVTGVITGGMEGGWREVVEAASSKQVQPVLVCHGTLVAGEAAAMGIPVFLRGHFKPGGQQSTFGNIVRAALGLHDPGV